jgi:hypothetical protein
VYSAGTMLRIEIGVNEMELFEENIVIGFPSNASRGQYVNERRLSVSDISSNRLH